MWGQVRDGLVAYETSKKFGAVMFWENLIASVIIGFLSQSLWGGVISFIAIMIAWSLPIIGTIMMIAVSGVYGFFVYNILNTFHVHPALCFGATVLAFLFSYNSHVMTAGH